MKTNTDLRRLIDKYRACEPSYDLTCQILFLHVMLCNRSIVPSDRSVVPVVTCRSYHYPRCHAEVAPLRAARMRCSDVVPISLPWCQSWEFSRCYARRREGGRHEHDIHMYLLRAWCAEGDLGNIPRALNIHLGVTVVRAVYRETHERKSKGLETRMLRS